MLAVGLTGGISSGKTTVSNMFAKLGIEVIDADVVAHQLTSAGSPLLEEIFNQFGEKSQLPDGSLNRRYLRDQIFSSPEKKNWLERYLHPRIRKRIIDQIAQVKSPYCIVAIPLLVESAGVNYIDRVLVVDTYKDNQVKRTMKRDHTSQKHALQIIDQQAPAEYRMAIADDIIHNNGSLEALQKKIEQLHQRYLELAES